VKNAIGDQPSASMCQLSVFLPPPIASCLSPEACNSFGRCHPSAFSAFLLRSPALFMLFCADIVMKSTIDVVIPSFRLEEKYILPILQLPVPEAVSATFYVIVDNPRIVVPVAIQEMVDGERVHLIINQTNIGAAETRNTGIDKGKGEWILFLDDDIVVQGQLLFTYADAIAKYSGEIGFIGMIELPEPVADFTKAVKASGSMDIFSIAARKKAFAWGATANIMINRASLKAVRFSTEYPKSGGGEDLDFFLNIRAQNGFKNYKTLPAAIVQHPWWNNEKINFSRPFRYGRGNSRLGKLNPSYTYRDFLNTPETILIAVVALIIVLLLKPGWVIPVLLFIAGILLIECIASGIQTIKRSKSANFKVMIYVVMLRLAQETGVLWEKILRVEWGRIGERFNDDGEINKQNIYRSNTYRIIKWILYPLLIWSIWYAVKPVQDR
jgi:GT2 family glycosyltransferase